MAPWQAGIWLVMAVMFGLIGWGIGKGTGRAGAGWWLGFLLSIIGVIIIACMSPTEEHRVQEAQRQYEIKAEASKSGRMRLAMLLAVVAVLVSAAAPVAASEAAAPSSTLQCGSTLLAGSNWLGGLGVAVKYNGPTDQGGGTPCGGSAEITVNGVPTGLEWQCPELVDRLYLTRGWITSYWSGNGGDSALGKNDSMYDYAPSSLAKQPNGSVSYVGPGDVVSVNEYDNGTFVGGGHVLIVNSTHRLTSGTVPMVSQNFGSPSSPIVTSSATLTSGTLSIAGSGGWTYQVIGVVHAPTWTPVAVSSGTNSTITAEACHTASSCVVVGYSWPRPLVVTESGTQWQASQPPLPASANVEGLLNSVACPSAVACVGVGYAGDPSTSDFPPLLETGYGASWSPAAGSLPTNAATPADGNLAGVSCYSTTSCTAVGEYFTTSNSSGDGLIETGSTTSGTSWTPHEVQPPASAGSAWGIQLSSVACPSATLCVAVGHEYDPSSGYEAGLLVTESGGSWAPAAVTQLPANAGQNSSSELDAVSCRSAASCAATGFYYDSSGNPHGLLVTWSGTGTPWTPAAAPLPADAAANSLPSLSSAACPSATSCVVAGWYSDSSGKYHGVVVTGWGKVWKATEAPLPANTQTPPNAQLHSVACQSATSCLAVGQYLDSSGNYQPLLVTGSNTAWQPTEAPLPTNAGPPAELEYVACPSTTWCVGAGTYPTGALLETGDPA